MEPGTVQAIIDAAQGGNWGVMAGAILLALAAIVRLVTHDRVSDNVESVISIVAAVVIAAGALMVGGLIWWQALLTGLLAGPAAYGFWDLVGKLIFKKG
jgi:hypothetical protein